MDDLLAALALVLVIEGLLLFSLPNRIDEILNIISSFSKKKIRLFGITSIIIGLILLYLIR